MKKYINMLGVLLVSGAIFVACGTTPQEPPVQIHIIPPQDQIDPPTPEPQPIEFPAEPHDLGMPPSPYEFVMNEAEMELYNSFVETLDIELIRDVSPFVLAKMWVTAGIEGHWEAEWLLIYEDNISMTREEFEAQSYAATRMMDRESMRERANWFFGLIEEGFFLDLGDHAYISFPQVADVLEAEAHGTDAIESQFHFVRGADGILRVYSAEPVSRLN